MNDTTVGDALAEAARLAELRQKKAQQFYLQGLEAEIATRNERVRRCEAELKLAVLESDMAKLKFAQAVAKALEKGGLLE